MPRLPELLRSSVEKKLLNTDTGQNLDVGYVYDHWSLAYDWAFRTQKQNPMLASLGYMATHLRVLNASNDECADALEKTISNEADREIKKRKYHDDDQVSDAPEQRQDRDTTSRPKKTKLSFEGSSTIDQLIDCYRSQEFSSPMPMSTDTTQSSSFVPEHHRSEIQLGAACAFPYGSARSIQPLPALENQRQHLQEQPQFPEPGSALMHRPAIQPMLMTRQYTSIELANIWSCIDYIPRHKFKPLFPLDPVTNLPIFSQFWMDRGRKLWIRLSGKDHVEARRSNDGPLPENLLNRFGRVWSKYDIYVSCIAYDSMVFLWVEFKKGRGCRASLEERMDVMNLKEVWMRLWDFARSKRDLGFFYEYLESTVSRQISPSRSALEHANRYCRMANDPSPVDLDNPATNLVSQHYH